jgi:hypothetical protein
MPPTTAAELETFTAALQDLCAGRSIGYREGDRVRDVRFLHTGPHEHVAGPVEFVVAAQGVKAAAVAGRRGAGLLSYATMDAAAWSALHDARGRAAGDSYVMTSLYVRDDGADPYGDAARDATGHTVLSFLVFAADKPAVAGMLGPEERAVVQRLLDRRGTTGTAPDRYLALYANYLGRIDPADRDLILPALIDRLTLVGTRDELRARLAAMAESGIDEVVIQPVVDPPAEMAELAKLAV